MFPAAFAGASFDHAQNDLAHPDGDLQRGGDGEQYVDRPRDGVGCIGIAIDQFRRDHDAKEYSGAGKSARGNRRQRAMILAFPHDARRPPPQPAEHKEHDDRRRRRDQQFGQIVAHPVGDQLSIGLNTGHKFGCGIRG